VLTTVTPLPDAATAAPPSTSAATNPPPSPDPRWVRPALVVVLLATAGLYLWSLGSSGWANAYYSAAVEAATKSWKAFFFGSFDSANLITVDKPPASLWVMDLSARLFGVNAWSILVPQALMGVATVGVLFATVRRWAGPVAGLLASVTLALTPVAALMFRFNNPDALLVLLLTCAGYAVVRAVDRDSTWWLVLAGALVGAGFLTKMLQAALVLPAFALVVLVAAPGSWRRRIGQLVAAGAAVVVASSWWVLVVQLWPASARPYIGGSQSNSVLDLLLGYNGLGRLTGNETGSVGGGAGPGGGTSASMWGETGWGRLFDAQYGGQASWLIPTALIALVALLALTWRRRRSDRTRATALLWGGWLLVTAAVISFSQGIIHPYYTVALAPAIAALVGVGAAVFWQRREQWWSAALLSGTVLVTALWSVTLLRRTPSWLPWLSWTVLIAAVLASVALLFVPLLTTRLARATAGLALAVVLAGPAAYTVATVTTPHSGSLPAAGPAAVSAMGGPGGATGSPPPGAFGPIDGGVGGLLSTSTPSSAVLSALSRDASSFTWVAATTGANQAAGYQLATGEAVMALGGFNGSDPSPTLAEFQQYVAEGRIHWFIAGGMNAGAGAGPGGPAMGGSTSGASSTASQIQVWVGQHYAATTVDGVTMYDLSGG
jgi:4-amino-4-deoxy-L-arabinose transferase-like glycosyltransferase